jgi:hypothetical protein
VRPFYFNCSFSYILYIFTIFIRVYLLYRRNSLWQFWKALHCLDHPHHPTPHKPLPDPIKANARGCILFHIHIYETHQRYPLTFISIHPLPLLQVTPHTVPILQSCLSLLIPKQNSMIFKKHIHVNEHSDQSTEHYHNPRKFPYVTKLYYSQVFTL